MPEVVDIRYDPDDPRDLWENITPVSAQKFLSRPLVFASGSRPQRCPAGHVMAAGQVIVGWTPCDCAEALAGENGHHYVTCAAEGCRAQWADPPHDGQAWTERRTV